MKTRSLLPPRVGAVLALVDPALRGLVVSVHDLRVAARSLRAGIRTLARRPRSSLVRRTRRSLRAAIRGLADARDRDVGRSLLTKLPAKVAEADLRRRMLRLSAGDRRVALARSAATWPKKLDRLLVDLLDRGEPALMVIIRRTRVDAWQQRRRAMDILGVLGRRYDPERLHELRRRIRALRYALEVLAEVETGAHARLAVLKPLQSALGDAQDNIVLSRWLIEQSAEIRTSDAALSSALRRAAAHFRARAVQSHATFLKLRPREVLNRLALHVDPSYASPAVRPAKSS